MILPHLTMRGKKYLPKYKKQTHEENHRDY